MDSVKNNFGKNSIVVCEPRSAGSSVNAKYYLYSGSIKDLMLLDVNDIPKVQAVDDVGNILYFPFQRGWLVRFKKIFNGYEQLVVYYKNEEIYVDFNDRKYCLSNGDIKINFKRFMCFIRASISYKNGSPQTMWLYFPWHRVFFVDDSLTNECHPFTDIFFELKDRKGIDLWISKWRVGLVVRNIAIKPKFD